MTYTVVVEDADGNQATSSIALTLWDRTAPTAVGDGAFTVACPRAAIDRAISTSTPQRAREPAARIPFLIARSLDDP